MAVNDELFGNNIKLSYSRLNLLKCPIKYYVVKFLGIQTYSLYAIIGIIVHKIYEDMLTDEIDYNDVVSNDNLIVSYIEDCIKEAMIPEQVDIDINELIPIIRQHIHKGLIEFIREKQKDGYELKVEDEHVAGEIKLLKYDDLMEVYIRPDVYLIKDNKVLLFDIKTSKQVNQYFKHQLIFYLNQLKQQYPNLNEFAGFIYLTQFDEIKQVVYFNNHDDLDKAFNKILRPIKQLYNTLGIKSIKDIKSFVKKVARYSESNLFELRCKITSHVGNVCGFCPIADICPVRKGRYSEEYKQLISGEKQSDMIVVFPYIANEATELKAIFT